MGRKVVWLWLVASACLLSLSGCGEGFWGDGNGGVRPYNTPPTVQITGPADGATVEQGVALEFKAKAGDTEDFATDLRVEWSSSIDGTLFSTQDAPQDGCPDLAGQCVFYTDGLSVGTHLITARVWDTGNFSASSQITLTILEKQEPPACEITAPEQDAVFTEGASIAFSALASDPNGDLMTLMGTWSSDLDGVLETRSPDPTGNLGYTTAGDSTPTTSGAKALSVGRHTITLTLEDTADLTGFCTRFVTVEARNRAPTVSIAAPADGSAYTEGDGVRFAGQVTDDRDDPTTLTVVWESSIQGVLSQAPADDAGNVSFVTSGLRPGLHTVSLKATDSGDKSSEATILVTIIEVNEAPVAQIVGAEPAGSALVGSSVTFTGLVSDPNEAPIGLKTSWTSSLQGDLPGGSAPDGDGDVFLSTAGLVVGTHAITLRVEDTKGLASTATATYIIESENAAPTASLTGPAEGTHTLGDSLLFAGTVGDAEDAPSSLRVQFFSDIDGELPFTGAPDDGGNVSFLYDGLTEGTHLITLRVTDADGAVGASGRVLTLRPENRPPTVSFTGPEVTVYPVGATVIFTALASDPEDNAQVLGVAISSDRNGPLCTSAIADAAGNILCSTSSLEAGTHVVGIRVTDRGGLSATDTLVVNIEAENRAPTAVIQAPVDALVFTEGTPVAFRGLATDPEDLEQDLTIEWESSLDGVFNEAAPDNAGNLIFTVADFSVGTHEVTLKVTDSAGAFAVASVVFAVKGENSPPTVEILTPAQDDLVFLSGSPILFKAQAGDAQDDLTTLDIVWASDREVDALSEAPADSSGIAQFTTAALSVGTHTVSIRVEDAEGRVAVASRRVIVRAPNSAPTVDISAPVDGRVATLGDVLTFAGRVGDSETAAGALSVAWRSNLDGVFNSTGADAGGNLGFTFAGLSVGTHLITLEATDGDGDSSSDSVTVTVRSQNSAPTAEIIAPSDGLLVQLGQQVVFTGQIGDVDEAATALSVSWTSDINGLLNAAPASSAGALSFATTALQAGTHLVTLRVEDAEGATAIDTVTVVVQAQNRPPTVDILAPTAGTFLVGESIAFEAQISDIEDAPRDLTVAWVSNLLPDPFNTGLSDASGRISFVYDGLPLGTHLVELRVTDTGGLVSTDSVRVTIRTQNDLPGVAITAPSDGASVFQGQVVSFEGQVSDTEDAATALAIAWRSDIDGVIGTTAANSAGVARLSISTLSSGTHTISLTAADTDGGIGADAITLTVRGANNQPTADITAPTTGLVAFQGDTITFQGKVLDNEDAETALIVSWTSNRDGDLGGAGADAAGNVVLATSGLSIGSHVITLRAEDLDGAVGTDTVNVTIRAVNNAPSVEIQSPEDADVYTEGDDVDFTGVATDVEDAEALLDVEWRSSLDGILSTDSLSAAGVSTFSVSDLGVGVHVITLRVTDLDGAVGTDSVEIIVEGPNQPPTIEILTPAEGVVFTVGAPITFQASVDDAESAPGLLAVTATSDLDGLFASPTADAGGNVAFSFSTLSVGTHFITLRVQDPDGAAATGNVTLRVRSPNAPPTATILTPADGGQAFEGATVVLTGRVADAEDAASALSVRWLSSRDGVLGTSNPDASGNVNLTADGLSVGTHTLTLEVTDTEAAVGTALITYRIRVPNTPPTAQIDLPAGGSIFFAGDVILFQGLVSDAQDAEDALAIRWSSSLDGVLNTDPADSGGTAAFTISTLSVGNHTITLRVTDLDGASVNKTISITVRPANALPEVEITGPATTTYVQGSAITLSAEASDAEDLPNQLTYQISSNRDGVLASGTPSAAGLISFTTTSLTVGTHVLTVRVVDRDAGVGTDTIQIVVNAPNTAPNATLTQPTTGATVNVGDVILFKGTASDAQDPAASLSFTLTSSRDGLLGSGNPTAAGNISVSKALSAGSHVITLTVTDLGGLSDSDTINVTAVVPNAPPTIVLTGPAVTAYEAGDPITFSAEVSDAEDAFASLSVRWTSDVDGQIFTGAPNASGISTFSTSILSVNTHVITATVTDTGGATASRSMTVVVSPANVPPSVSITSPGNGGIFETGDAILFAGLATDPETANSALVIEWRSSLDGVLNTSSPDSSGNVGFSTNALEIGTHTITLKATDGAGSFSTASINIVIEEANLPPSQPNVVITPAGPKTANTLTAVPSGSTDPNGDLVSYQFQWFKNGAAQAGQTTDTLLSSATAKGDVWKVRVTPTDGQDPGPFAEASVTILNTAPSVSSVQVTPVVAYETSTLTVQVNGFSDPDSGDPDLSVIDWYVNGVTKVATGVLSIDGDLFGKEDVVSVRVTPSDGEDAGATVLSNGVTILNTGPTEPVVTLSPTDPNQGENLVCEVTGVSTDVDGDAVTYLYEWYKNGALQSGETRSDTATAVTLAAAKTTLGDTWRCEVTPSDGDLDGTSDEDLVDVLPDAGDLVFTELMINPVAVTDERGEYVEIYNATALPIFLDGFILRDAVADSHAISSGGSLFVPAGGYVLLGRDERLAENGGVAVDYQYSNFALSDTGDTAIVSFEGRVIDTFSYGSANVPAARSYSLDPGSRDAVSNDLVANWCPAVTDRLSGGDFGSPGFNNEPCACFDSDGDADGYGDDAACSLSDCNDANPAINPAATDICDTQDRDCDGSIQPCDCETTDDDGDGFGDGVSCVVKDCDDGDPNIYPGRAEVCDGVDQDCDSSTDEGFDADGDGFTTCNGDCNDVAANGGASSYPGASPICDAYDNDCDGNTDEGFDGDGDGNYTCAIGPRAADCDDANPARYQGNTEICDAYDNDCDIIVNEGFEDDYEPNNITSQAAIVGSVESSFPISDGTIHNASDSSDYFEFTSTDSNPLAFTDGFFVGATLSSIPSGTNYDLYLYRKGSTTPLDGSSTSSNTNETVRWDGQARVDDGGTFLIEVRRISGFSCSDTYALTIQAGD